MSAVNEWVVREYFESLGYLVSQPRKYAVPTARPKTAAEEVDLVVINPQVVAHRIPEHILWITEDLHTVARAMVSVRGWHTEVFSASRLEQTPEIFRFTEPGSVRFASRMAGYSDLARILCLPRLPTSDELKEKSIQALKTRGVDGVISFQTMLLELVDMVDINKNYEKSDLLQVIRLLKMYDLVKDSQLEMFGRQRRRIHSGRKGAAKAADFALENKQPEADELPQADEGATPSGA